MCRFRLAQLLHRRIKTLWAEATLKFGRPRRSEDRHVGGSVVLARAKPNALASSHPLVVMSCRWEGPQLLNGVIYARRRLRQVNVMGLHFTGNGMRPVHKMLPITSMTFDSPSVLKKVANLGQKNAPIDQKGAGLTCHGSKYRNVARLMQ